MLKKRNSCKIFIIILSAVLSASVFFKGLYDVDKQFVFMLAVSLVFGIFCIKQKLSLRPESTFDWFMLSAISVYILCTIDAVSIWDSLMAVSRYICCFMIYVMVKNAVDGNRDLMYKILYFVSSAASLFGILCAIGVIPLSGAYDFKRSLLLSVFHYHNASAVFFACIFVFGIYLFDKSQNKILNIAIGVCNSCLFSSIIYSQSRGTWLVFFISVVVYLILDRKSENFGKSIVLILASGISVAAVMKPFISGFSDRAINGECNEAWACVALVAISLVIGGLISAFADNKKINKLFSGKNLIISIPIICVLCCVALIFVLPEAIIERISEFSLSSSTVSERTIFFRDAVRILKNNPINGIGGDGWKYVYPSVQSNYYTVGHPHSFLAEMFTDAGSLGILLYAFMLVCFAISFVKQRNNKTVFPALVSALMLLMHSFFDFETDYLTILAFLFAMFALISQPYKAEKKNCKLILAVPAVILVWSLLNIFAYYNYQAAAEKAETSDISEVYAHTLLSTKLMPLRVDYLTTHGNVCLGRAGQSARYLDEAENTLLKSFELNTYNYETITQFAVLYARIGDYEKAGEYVALLAKLQPFINTTYERVSYVYEVLVNYGTNSGDYDCIRYAANMLIDTVNDAWKLSEEKDAYIQIFVSVRDNIEKAKEILTVLDEAGV